MKRFLLVLLALAIWAMLAQACAFAQLFPHRQVITVPVTVDVVPAVCTPAAATAMPGPHGGPGPGPAPGPRPDDRGHGDFHGRPDDRGHDDFHGRPDEHHDFHGGPYVQPYVQPYINPWNFVAPLVVNYETAPRSITNPMTGVVELRTPGQWVAVQGGYAWQALPMWPLLGTDGKPAAPTAAGADRPQPVRNLFHRIFKR